MTDQKPIIDYAAILADLEAKKIALEQSIAGIRAGLSLGVLGSSGDGTIAAAVFSSAGSSNASFAAGPPIELPTGAFLGMNIPAAVKLYLSAVRSKKTNREITHALKKGGIESNSKLDALVTSALFRLKSAGELLRYEDGWGLAEWAPKGLRNSMPEAKPKNGKKPPTKKRLKKTQGESKSESKKNKSAEGPTAILTSILKKAPTAEWTMETLMNDLTLSKKGIQILVGKLIKQGLAEKLESGKIRGVILA